MIHLRHIASLCAAGSLAVASASFANIQIGQAAPDFALTDVSGKAVKLSDYKGKHVVLEWTNPNCPYVKKHYDSKNMQGLQSAYAGKGVVWLAINSTSTGHQDYMKPAALNDKLNAWGSKPSATLMDADGKTGTTYGAKTTPHMYIVDPQGKLIYAGGIDDKRSANPADIPSSKNFVRAALDETLAGKPVSVATSTPYGCSVKYNAL
jgi:peroxiredoxin